jgi:hypothetical protein
MVEKILTTLLIEGLKRFVEWLEDYLRLRKAAKKIKAEGKDKFKEVKKDAKDKTKPRAERVKRLNDIINN